MSKKTILIVDDLKNNLDYLEKILEDTYHIVRSYNGLEAFNILKKSSNIDLILLDILMPKVDGYELCEKLKNDSNFKHIL